MINFEELKELAKSKQDSENSDIKRLESLIKPERLTEYELTFIDSIKRCIIGKYPLSDKQKLTLGKILLKCS